jgi:5-deoxy-glucuronate isomerase
MAGATDHRMTSTTPDLLVRPTGGDPGVVTRITAEDAGWEHLNMEVRRLGVGDTWAGETGGCEAAFVMLGGTADFETSAGTFEDVGRRENVFTGMPWALYLSRGTDYVVTAKTDCEIAHCWVESDEDHPPQLVTPDDSEIEIRGGNNANRQINSIIPPGFDCHRIVACEVCTPGGNWSSYPPHKHDEHREDEEGNVLEADLEEFYYYKIDNSAGPNGYAVQRVYTDDRSLDFVGVAHDDDVILVPEGYHPVSAAYGYDCYYLNFLAGSAQSLANSDDPEYAWVKETWDERDPRLPIVSREMEKTK